MRILKIIHGYPPTYNAGSEVYSQNICNELSKVHEVHIFTREENPYLPDFQIRTVSQTKNLTLHILNKRFDKDGFRNNQIDRKFQKLVEEIQPDIAHVGHLNHLSTGIIDILDSLHIPIIFTLHDFWLMCPRGQFLQRNYGNPNYFQVCEGQENRKCATHCYNMYLTGIDDGEDEIQFWTHWIDKRMKETIALTSKIDLFIAPSHYLRNRFIHEFQIPEQKIIYLDYGFQRKYLTKTPKKESKEFVFGYIGTHIPSKGVNLLIEAFINVLSKTNLGCKLIIFGREQGQNTKYLKTLSKGYPIEFQPEYANEEIAEKVFSKVDCIVVPSIWAENSPLVIHETQEARIPVITANHGGMKEFVKDKVNGLLFEHRNSEDLTDKMIFTLENREYFRELGKRGYLYSENGDVISIEEHCTELEKIYHSIMKK